MGLARSQLRWALPRLVLLTAALSALAGTALASIATAGALREGAAGVLARSAADVAVVSQGSGGDPAASVVTSDQVEAIGFLDGVGRVLPMGVSTATAVPGASANGGGDGDRGGARAGVAVSLVGLDFRGPGRPGTLVAGRLPRRANEALAAETLAGSGMGIGDDVAVAGAAGTTLRVVGLLRDGGLDGLPALRVRWADYGDLTLAAHPGSSSVVPYAALVEVDRGASPEAVASSIESAIAGTVALPTGAAATAVPAGPAGAVVAVLAALGVAALTAVAALGFMVLAVREEPTLARLRALGASRRRLVAGRLGVGVVVAVLATGLGGAMAWAVTTAAVGGPALPVGLPTPAIAGWALALTALTTAASLPALVRVARAGPGAAPPSTRERPR